MRLNLVLLVFSLCFSTAGIIDKAFLYASQPPQYHIENIKFKLHKVRKREILSSIASKYNVSEDLIKRYNDKLYHRDVEKKDVLRIPIINQDKSSQVVQQSSSTQDENPVKKVLSKIFNKDQDDKPTIEQVAQQKQKELLVVELVDYKIQPKDTKYSLARKHGITITELEDLNPNLNGNFPAGVKIKLPVRIVAENQLSDYQNYMHYEVHRKETLYSLSKRFQISIDSLTAVNPYVRDGLREGMILNVPVPNEQRFDNVEQQAIALDEHLFNFDTKNIALLLPFGADKLTTMDPQQIKSHLVSRKDSRIAVDFYSGAIIALQAAKAKGISTDVTILDTKGKRQQGYLAQWIAPHSKDFDAIIGPFYNENVQEVAKFVNPRKTKVFSPISRKKITNPKNVFQVMPSKEVLEQHMINFIKRDTLPNNTLLIIQDTSKYDAKKSSLKAHFPKATIVKVQKGNYVHPEDIVNLLSVDLPNRVILEGHDMGFISNVIPTLNAKARTYDITLFTTIKTKAFKNDNINNQHLGNLKFHYPSANKDFADGELDLRKFELAYQRKYGILPSRYAVRGYDLVYDILLRLATSHKNELLTQPIKTQVVENSFQYQENILGGYINTASYILRYNDDLTIRVVE